jgi:hypothetical protein
MLPECWCATPNTTSPPRGSTCVAVCTWTHSPPSFPAPAHSSTRYSTLHAATSKIFTGSTAASLQSCHVTV